MNYAQKLKDPRWQRLRLEAMESAGWKCAHCEATDKTLNTHHKHYIKGREPWEYSQNMLLVLCNDCHEEIHKGDESLSFALATSGYTPTQLADLIEGIDFFSFSSVDPKEFDASIKACLDAVLSGDRGAVLFLCGVLAGCALHGASSDIVRKVSAELDVSAPPSDGGPG